MGKVRVINVKTGKVLLVAEHIANNAKRLKSYGFIKQDFEVRNDKTIEEIREEYFKKTGKKPGIKKQETLLKEIQELETKQNL